MKLNQLTFLILFLMVCISPYAQFFSGARSLSLAGNSVTLNDVYTVHSNPGIISQIKEIQIGSSYSKPYLISEFQQQSIANFIPIQKGGIIIRGVFSGKELFRQQKIGLGYGFSLNEKLSIGIGLNHQELRVQHYKSSNKLTADIGFLAKINDKLTLGASILSVGGNQSKENLERFPSIMQIGIKYAIHNQFDTYISIDKTALNSVCYRIGFEYEAYKNLWFRTGCVLNAKVLAFGIGYELPMRLRIDLGTQWNQILGWTPHIGLLYRFTTKK